MYPLYSRQRVRQAIHATMGNWRPNEKTGVKWKDSGVRWRELGWWKDLGRVKGPKSTGRLKWIMLGWLTKEESRNLKGKAHNREQWDESHTSWQNISIQILSPQWLPGIEMQTYQKYVYCQASKGETVHSTPRWDIDVKMATLGF